MVLLYPLFVLVTVHKNTLLIFNGTKTQGTVINTTYVSGGSGGRYYLGKTPVANISYMDSDGNNFILKETGRTNIFWTDGQTVSVYYDNENPDHATTFTIRKIISFLSLFLFCFALFIGIRYAAKRKEGF